MLYRLLVCVCALVLVSACETSSKNAGAGAGAGNLGAANAGIGETGVQAGPWGAPDRVFFAYDSSSLSSDAQNTLGREAAWLQANPRANITIEGHADERGTREYNLALGERRANAAKKFLVNSGVAASRIAVISYGKERPAVLGSTEAAWSQNRRAVTVVNQ